MITNVNNVMNFISSILSIHTNCTAWIQYVTNANMSHFKEGWDCAGPISFLLP